MCSVNDLFVDKYLSEILLIFQEKLDFYDSVESQIKILIEFKEFHFKKITERILRFV